MSVDSVLLFVPARYVAHSKPNTSNVTDPYNRPGRGPTTAAVHGPSERCVAMAYLSHPASALSAYFMYSYISYEYVRAVLMISPKDYPKARDQHDSKRP